MEEDEEAYFKRESRREGLFGVSYLSMLGKMTSDQALIQAETPETPVVGCADLPHRECVLQ